MIFLPCIISGLSKNRTKLIGLHVAQTQTMKFFSLFQQGNILKIDTKKSMLLGRHEILFELCKNLLTVSKCEQCKDFKSRVLVNGTCISSAYQIANAKWHYIAKTVNSAGLSWVHCQKENLTLSAKADECERYRRLNQW